ncbi:MAG: SDR family oxidoreductase [Alphaproteobacteria bacterium]|nr:SDR family oxidoreductase [Alphaproteobacteria bacterium]
MRFRDSVVWVTGASSGIGEHLARLFHAEGAHVVLSARREDALSRVAEACDGPGDTMILPLDVTDETAIGTAAGQVSARFGRVDILVNNAGLTQRGRIAETSLDVYRRIMDVNFFGPLMLTKAVLPSMTERGSGRIVCVTSVAGKYGSPMRSGYNAAKHAAHGFFDSLREEVARHGIDVTLIVPGTVRTDVSLNALRGDGSLYGRMDPFLASGMDPADCAGRILDAVHARKREVLIASGVARRNVWLKRLSPALLSWVTRRRKS